MSHPCYLDGELPLCPSAINLGEQVDTPDGFASTLLPQEYSVEAIKKTLAEYRQAAAGAKMAGFDGIELHAQLFTLIPQFLSAATNQRSDAYGDSIQNRCRIFFEILDKLVSIFPGNKVGVEFTPAAFNNGIIQPDEETIDTFAYILGKLNDYDIAFVELVGPRESLKGTPIATWEDDFFGWFRSHFKGTIIANLGFLAESADDIILQKKAVHISIGWAATPSRGPNILRIMACAH
ncbi:hypothetical protein LXM25_04625 [Dyadobacter sp. LJ53]|nr:hypothetical protein [Dyadobacter chenwenxiniae]